RPAAGRAHRATWHRERLHRAPEGHVARVGHHGGRAHEADDDHGRRFARLARAGDPLCGALPGDEPAAVAAGPTSRATARAGDGMTAIEVRGLRAKRGFTEVLCGIDLTVARGEVVAVLGASGSGKTTLLRALNYLTPFSAGEV